jgi:MoxR-like ATPase
MVRIMLGYLPLETELDVVRRNISGVDGETIEQAVTGEEIHEAFKGVRSVKVADDILDYIARLAAETRADPRIGLGASPRALIQLAKCSRAKAYVSGRDYVIPDDVKEMVPYVYPHRLRLSQSSLLTGDHLDTVKLVQEIVGKVSPPR